MRDISSSFSLTCLGSVWRTCHIFSEGLRGHLKVDATSFVAISRLPLEVPRRKGPRVAV